MKKILLIVLLTFITVQSQTDLQKIFKSESKEYSLTDFGKMWTFDDLPKEYWENEYNFIPSPEWIEDVMKSALQFGGGCSGAFVSANGLIMSNHHCARSGFVAVQKEDEDILKNGFYASSSDDERKIPNLYVDQLVKIWDITDQLLNLDNKEDSIKVLEEKYSAEFDLTCKVVNLYNGNKFSMYGYKRYNDVRLVMAPEFQTASTGWDWDNFTYPRYELDFAFFRAYDEDGKPIKTENYFKWSEEGTSENDLIFTLGRPGRTERLISMREFEYQRDKRYPAYLTMYDEFYNVYYNLFVKYPERESELLNQVMGIGNGKKAFLGEFKGLLDDYVLNRKTAFENDLKMKILESPELTEKYYHIFEAFDITFNEISKISDEFYAYRLGLRFKSDQQKIAEKVNEFITDSLNLSEEKIDKFLDELYSQSFDDEKSEKLLQANINVLKRILGAEDYLIKKLTEQFNFEAENIIAKSIFADKQKVKEILLNQNEDAFKNDPLIVLINSANSAIDKLSPQLKELNKTIEDMTRIYGEAVFAIFGNEMPPDATSTLRISDGVVKRYEYNGTLAQPFTTFYGMYDRYFGFGKETYPWGLTANWEVAYNNINLSTPLNFASTNDIVGGNSGSSVINKDGEVVGLVFDGNMESLYGNFIYLPETNRTIAVDVRGILEALKKVYKAERIVEELLEN